MEPIHERHKTSKFTPEDFISNMPDNVVTNFLDRLPIQDAVRTCVLSCNWRLKWTMLISQLVFDDDFLRYLTKTGGITNHVRIISGVLLQLRGDITKFVLSVTNDDDEDEDEDEEDISHWILFLSRKGIKDFTLEYFHVTPLALSTHLFSCLELKHLKLYNCYFNPPSSFRGFPNLLSLDLRVVFGENTQLGEFFTQCPLLEALTMEDFSQVGTAKAVEIAKVENLKTLSINLYDLDNEGCISLSTIFELLGYLPKLEELYLDFHGCKLARPSPPLDYNAIELKQLQSVTFKYLNGSENELCLIKYLLMCSPFLEKIVIHPNGQYCFSFDEKLALSIKLLKLHRASTVAEIDFF